MKRATISISVKEVLLGSVFCHGARGSQERGGEELLLGKARQVYLYSTFHTHW